VSVRRRDNPDQTWDLVTLPLGKKPITARWVYKVKTGSQGTKQRLKARLVAQGFEQRPGIDYDETFAPTVKWATIRLVTAIAATFGWDIHHMDFITAFLNSPLKEDVFMLQPPGFAVPGKEDLVCKL
jgi:hypothetical protein